MLESAAEIIVTFGSLALTILGVVVSIIPNLARRRERWLFVAAFVAIGAVVSAVNYSQLRSSNMMQQEVWGAATGGNNAPYFELKKSVTEIEARVSIVNPGNTPLYDIRAYLVEIEDING